MSKLRWVPNEALGITEEQAREAVEAVNPKGEWEHFTPEFVGTKAVEVDVQKALCQMKAGQRLFEQGRIDQPYGRADFATPYPITVAFLGDIHYGSVYTDHQQFHDDMDLIANTPNFYLVLMSNLIDNGIPSQFPDMMLRNAIPPDKQVIVMRQIIEGLNAKGKVLGAIVSPCHEGWTYKKAGQDINTLLFGFEGRYFPVLENGAELTLSLLKVKYLLGLYHQVGPFESYFNETHALRQMNRLNHRMRCDVVVGAHKHVAAAEMVWEGVGQRHRRPVAYLRVGSYAGVGKINDLWSKGRYGTTGEPPCPSVTLWPGTRQMETHLSLEMGILAHKCHLAWSVAERVD